MCKEPSYLLCGLDIFQHYHLHTHFFFPQVTHPWIIPKSGEPLELGAIFVILTEQISSLDTLA